MQRLRSRSVALLAGVALFALSGIALAADGDDTVFNYGYDENSHFFAWNVTSLDWEPNQDLLDELLEGDPTLGDDEFALLLAVCGLGPDEGMDPTEYGYVSDGETVSLYEVDGLGEFDPEVDEPVDLMGCNEFVGGDVTGPAGQVNHGMFLKFFNENYEGENRGCIVRHIARSDLGKYDQQVKPGDPDDGYVAPAEGESIEGTITFTTVAADCEKGPDRDGEEGGDRRGPPDHAKNKADKWGGDGPGKSGSAGKGRP